MEILLGLLLAIFYFMKENKKLKRKITRYKEDAFFDFLTQIPNRRRIDHILNREWERAKRSQEKIAVIMADIDHFKAYNDTYGHQEGDSCLYRIAREMESAVRPSDTLGRFGGEEFMVILSEIKHFGDEVNVAERLRAQVEKTKIPNIGSSVKPIVTLSVGVAVGTPGKDFISAEEMVKVADEALYEAKHSGRNQVKINRGR